MENLTLLFIFLGTLTLIAMIVASHDSPCNHLSEEEKIYNEEHGIE